MALGRTSRFLSLSCKFGLLICWAVPASADIASAARAYQNGDYSTAFKEFMPLAEQGSAQAQSYVAYMYEVGEGVGKNYVEAAWLLAGLLLSAETGAGFQRSVANL
jgi:hypothetical protein